MAENITINNFLRGLGIIEGSLTSQIDCELKVAEESSLLTEIQLAPNRTNFFRGTVGISPIPLKELNIYSDNDVYITDKNKYYSYYKSSTLKQGTIDGYSYKTFIRFDDILNVEDRLIKTIIETNLLLTSISSYTGNIKIYETEYTISEKDITWMSYPKNGKLIASIDVVDCTNISIPVTNHIKSVLERKELHKGFCIETDNYLNIYSSNSIIDVAKPRLQLKYYDPDLLLSTHSIDSELILTPVKTLPSELNLVLPFPILECSLNLCKDSILCDLNLRNVSTLDSELSLVFNEEAPLDCEILFSKDMIHNELKLASIKELETELNLIAINENVIEAELKLIPVKILRSSLFLAWDTKLDAELIFKDNAKTYLPSEILFSKDNLDSELKLIAKGTTNLDSEVLYKSTNNKYTIPCELIISKPNLNSRLLLKFSDKLDAEVLFSKITEDSLPAELELAFESYGNEYVLPSEVLFKSVGNKTEIESELQLVFKQSTSIPSELQILFEKSLSSEVLLKFVDVESILNSELLYKSNNESILDVELLLELDENNVHFYIVKK